MTTMVPLDCKAAKVDATNPAVASPPTLHWIWITTLQIVDVQFQ